MPDARPPASVPGIRMPDARPRHPSPASVPDIRPRHPSPTSVPDIRPRHPSPTGELLEPTQNKEAILRLVDGLFLPICGRAPLYVPLFPAAVSGRCFRYSRQLGTAAASAALGPCIRLLSPAAVPGCQLRSQHPAVISVHSSRPPTSGAAAGRYFQRLRGYLPSAIIRSMLAISAGLSSL